MMREAGIICRIDGEAGVIREMDQGVGMICRELLAFMRFLWDGSAGSYTPICPAPPATMTYFLGPWRQEMLIKPAPRAACGMVGWGGLAGMQGGRGFRNSLVPGGK